MSDEIGEGLSIPGIDENDPLFFTSRVAYVPGIGEVITRDDAIYLCGIFRIYDVHSDLVSSHPSEFIPFKFDGVSGMPERASRIIFNVDVTRDIYSDDSVYALTLQGIALAHDLRYAFGKRGDSISRKNADAVFKSSLQNCVTTKLKAWLGWSAVRVFGGKKNFVNSKYVWGFSRM